MFKKIAISSTLLLLAGFAMDATVQVLETEGASIAHAGGIDAKVKRIRIKRQRTGEGYKVVTQTSNTANSSSTAGSTNSMNVVLSTTDGKLLEETTIKAPSRERVKASATVSTKSLTVKSVLTVSVYQDANYQGEAQEFTVELYELDDGYSEGANKYGWKVQATLDTESGELKLLVLNEDGSIGAGNIEKMTVDLDGTTVSASVDEVRQRWTYEASTDLSAYESVSVATTFYDGDGALLDSQTETVSVEASASTPELSKVTLKENKKGYAKLATWTISDGSAAALEVDLVDSKSGESVLMTVDDNPVRTQQAFVAENIAFEDAAEGSTYLVLVEMLDADGMASGEQYEVELTVPKAGEDGSNGTSYVTFAKGAAQASFVTNANGYHYHLAFENELYAGANIIFEEPYEGPAPLETEVSAELAMQFDKWTQVGESSAPASYELTTSLTDADGNELDTLSATGTGTGRVATTRATAKYGDNWIAGAPLEFE
jgi:hypothetical protein